MAQQDGSVDPGLAPRFGCRPNGRAQDPGALPRGAHGRHAEEPRGPHGGNKHRGRRLWACLLQPRKAFSIAKTHATLMSTFEGTPTKWFPFGSSVKTTPKKGTSLCNWFLLRGTLFVFVSGAGQTGIVSKW